MPLPSEDTTPPVTKMKRVRGRGSGMSYLLRQESRAHPGGSPQGAGLLPSKGDFRPVALGRSVGCVAQ